MNTINELAVTSRNVGLLDVLDRVLDKGVVVDGDIQLCVAGIELVYLKLKLLLASTAAIERFASPDNYVDMDCAGTLNTEFHPAQIGKKPVENPKNIVVNPVRKESSSSVMLLRDDEPNPIVSKPVSDKVDIDPKKVEQGLAKLVLTLVELLRKLMEKQALRRMELGTLSEKQIDSLGEAFMRLDSKMKELKVVFGLKDGDLNLDLGPLGDLI